MTISNPSTRALVNYRDSQHWFDTMSGERMTVRVDSRQVGGALTVIEAAVPVGGGPPLHLHKDREETFEILEGLFRFRCGTSEFEVGPGTTVVVPRGLVHGWANVGTSEARILFIFTPGGLEEFFPKIGTTPPDQWAALAEGRDTFIVGPPLITNVST